MAQDMYDSSMAAARCAVGLTDGFKLEVGPHQGSEEVKVRAGKKGNERQSKRDKIHVGVRGRQVKH